MYHPKDLYAQTTSSPFICYHFFVVKGWLIFGDTLFIHPTNVIKADKKILFLRGIRVLSRVIRGYALRSCERITYGNKRRSDSL